ncbi:MAG: RNA polymerase sigma factor [Gammaproteobacteria bacterium]|nr:MAG: RNA polymerase sigma factor [Gammaproteobacteria bacterium]
MQTPAPDPIRSTEFASFMHAYQDMVFSTAARLLGNEAQAQDVAQDVFLKAYENFEQLRTSATKGGWLKTVTTNLSLNHLSRYRRRWRLFSESRREQATEEESQLDLAVADGALDGIAAEERRLLVEQALRRLPEHQRVPLVLYHFEELSYEDIARQLRISLAKVRSDILRARVRLANLLARAQL